MRLVDSWFPMPYSVVPYENLIKAVPTYVAPVSHRVLTSVTFCGTYDPSLSADSGLVTM